jgi:Sec-independent protein secretion pathway component TatC
MWLLFEVGILLARLNRRNRGKNTREAEEEEAKAEESGEKPKG